MRLLAELRRRNVIRVAILYIVIAWLVMQVTDVVSSLLSLPHWTGVLVVTLLALGFVPVLIFSWVFELTPEGLKLEKDVDPSASVTQNTAQKLNVVIVALLAIAVASFWVGHFLSQKSMDAVSPAGEEGFTSEAGRNTIAVLPFVNMSPDSENEYFSDGLSEELINLLTRIPDLRVAARTSSFTFKASDKTISEIAELLNVAHVLEGSVRKSGNQVRIAAQLIAAESGFQLWSATYERKLDSVFRTQEEIAEAVTDALKLKLLGDIPALPRTDVRAYEHFLKCQQLSHRNDMSSLERAIASCKAALEIDDRYAPAWAELGASQWWYTGYSGTAIDEGIVFASECVERALSLDPVNAHAYFVRGMLRTASHFDFSRGFADFNRAAELEPGNSEFVLGTAAIAWHSGQLELAIERLEKAIRLDPLSPRLYAFLSLYNRTLGRNDAAEAAVRKALSLNPSFIGAHYSLAQLSLQQGRIDEARRQIQREPLETYRLTGLAMVHIASGNEAEARTTLEQLIEIGSEVSAFQIAEVFAALGDIDRSFEWLTIARKIRDSGVASIVARARFFQLLHSDPRWNDFLEDMGLFEAWQAMPPEWGGPVI